MSVERCQGFRVLVNYFIAVYFLCFFFVGGCGLGRVEHVRADWLAQLFLGLGRWLNLRLILRLPLRRRHPRLMLLQELKQLLLLLILLFRDLLQLIVRPTINSDFHMNIMEIPLRFLARLLHHRV